MPDPSRLRTFGWVAAGLALAGLVVGAAWLLQPPVVHAPATSPAGAPSVPPHEAMDGSARCAHMPEHCGNRTAPP